MAAETQYTANTALLDTKTANSSLDGTGAETLLTVPGGVNGTLIKSVYIKSMETGAGNDYGMIRLYAYDGTNTKLITEVNIPAIKPTGTEPSFGINVPINYILEPNGILKLTNQTGDTFAVVAEGLDWVYYGSVRPESTRYTANNGFALINSANTSLDGSGTLNTDIWDVITGASNGTIIQSITIKARVSTTPGMVRLFINNGSSLSVLFAEIPVPAVTLFGPVNSFSYRLDFGGKDFALKSGYKIRATTQKSEAFNVIAEGLDWTYPA